MYGSNYASYPQSLLLNASAVRCALGQTDLTANQTVKISSGCSLELELALIDAFGQLVTQLAPLPLTSVVQLQFVASGCVSAVQVGAIQKSPLRVNVTVNGPVSAGFSMQFRTVSPALGSNTITGAIGDCGVGNGNPSAVDTCGTCVGCALGMFGCSLLSSFSFRLGFDCCHVCCCIALCNYRTCFVDVSFCCRFVQRRRHRFLFALQW